MWRFLRHTMGNLLVIAGVACIPSDDRPDFILTVFGGAVDAVREDNLALDSFEDRLRAELQRRRAV